MPIAVIRLTPSDAERFARFREEMLTDSPWAFASTLEDDDSLDLVHMRRVLGERENAIIAVEAAETLVATAGILRMNSSKFSHRAKLWGVFVTPDHRGRGLGRAVTTAAIELARSWEGVEFV